MEQGTFVLALIGALTGVAALAWSVLEFLFGGAWVKVRLVSAWIGPGGAVTSESQSGWSRSPDQALPTPAIGIVVINRGRHPTTVASVSFSGEDFNFVPLGLRIGPPIPYRLEGQSAESWFLELREAVGVQESFTDVMKTSPKPIRAIAHLATGKKRVSANSLRLPPLG